MLKAEFRDCLPPVGDRDIDEVERKMGVVFPNVLRRHFKQFNGGTTVKAAVRVGDRLFAVHDFMSIKHGNSNIDDTFNYLKPILPANMLPFASDPGGNFYCVFLRVESYGKVYFVDHEELHDPEQAFEFMLDSFELFLDSLTDDEK